MSRVISAGFIPCAIFFLPISFVRMKRIIKMEYQNCLNITILSFQLFLCPVFAFWIAYIMKGFTDPSRRQERREEHVGEEG